MAEFNLSTFLVTIVLFSLFIGGFALIYGDIGGNYNTKVDTSFNQTYEKINRMENLTLSISDTVQSEDPGALDAFFLAGKTILSAPKLLLESLGIFTAMIFDLGSDIGIPAIFRAAMIAIITILVIFAIISLWARWKT